MSLGSGQPSAVAQIVISGTLWYSTVSGITETTAGVTWPSARRELDRLHVGTFTGPAGTFQQLTALTSSQRDLLAKLAIPVPRQIINLQSATR